VEWPVVVPQDHDAQPLPVDDDPSKVDWLAIKDESEQATSSEKGPDLTRNLLG
jgi:hypothetical protein